VLTESVTGCGQRACRPAQRRERRRSNGSTETGTCNRLDAFERAFAEDPSFWWVYFRSLVPRTYREASATAETVILRRIFEHRWRLPEPDRLLVEVSGPMSLPEQFTRLRDLTDRFPQYSPGLWSHPRLLVLYGLYLGRRLDEARAALTGSSRCTRSSRLRGSICCGWLSCR
jgi:hypothetical protein